MSSSKGKSSDIVPTSEETLKKDQPKVVTIKGSISNIGWKPEYIENLKDLVQKVHKLVSHTYAFTKFIFIQELENNQNFNLEEYAVKEFYKEVFLSLVDYKPRGGESGNSKLSDKVKKFRDILKKYLVDYKELTLYKPIKLSNAYQIANYESIKIDTAYKNSIVVQFGNRLRMFINKLVKTKERISSLKKELMKDGCSESEIKDKIKTTILDPVNHLKLAISTRDVNQIPRKFLDDKPINSIEEFISAYPKTYKFKKDSIYYDAKASPEKHLFAYYKLAKICECSQLKSFHCFPVRRTFIPAHITIDTLILNTQILKKSGQKKLDKQSIWSQVVNISCRAMKPQGHDKSLQFRGTILTDGIAVSIIKQNFETGKRASANSCSKIIEDDVKYIENISKPELDATISKCVYIDPGRRDLLYCMHEKSTAKYKRIYRYTRNQKALETKSTKFRKLRQKLKPDKVQECEKKLSRHVISTINIQKFNEYLKCRSEVEHVLTDYYSNENIPKENREHNLLPFRKMKLSAYINNIQADRKLAKNLRRKFGEDCVIVLGDWSGGHTKFHEPIRGKGTRKMLKKQGFLIYVLNEFKTSSVCPSCGNLKLEKFKACKNPRPYQRQKYPSVKCHGLLRCPNQNCLKSMASTETNNLRLYNRDLVAVLNYHKIVTGLRENNERPGLFKRKNINDDIRTKKPRTL